MEFADVMAEAMGDATRELIEAAVLTGYKAGRIAALREVGCCRDYLGNYPLTHRIPPARM